MYLGKLSARLYQIYVKNRSGAIHCPAPAVSGSKKPLRKYDTNLPYGSYFRIYETRVVDRSTWYHVKGVYDNIDYGWVPTSSDIEVIDIGDYPEREGVRAVTTPTTPTTPPTPTTPTTPTTTTGNTPPPTSISPILLIAGLAALGAGAYFMTKKH